MDGEQIRKTWQALNEATGQERPLPDRETIDALVAFGNVEEAAFLSGERFYASDCCMDCDNYSGYGVSLCEACAARRTSGM